MTFAGALVGEAMTYDNVPLDYLVNTALRDLIRALPWVTGGTVLWILIAYKFHQLMIDVVTGGREVSRQEHAPADRPRRNASARRTRPMGAQARQLTGRAESFGARPREKPTGHPQRRRAV